MKEVEKMVNGLIYDPSNSELAALRNKAHKLCIEYNSLTETDKRREEILNELLPNKGKNCYLQGPIQFDYGVFTEVGDNFYANFNFTVLDTCHIKIGKNVYIGPNCSIYTPLHPLLPKEREYFIKKDGVASDYEYGKSVTIGSDCWIAGGVTICSGVKIGSGVVIGAGSVVVKDIPDHVLAAGNPCKVIRELTDKDSIFNKKDIWEDKK